MAETLLLGTLRDYCKQFEDHLAALRDRHQDLQTAWLRLRDVYEGQGAQVFSEAFEAASARLTDYAERGSQITRQLEAKLEELRIFQAE